MSFFLTLSLALVAPQSGDPVEAAPVEASADDTSGATPATAEDLRVRIREMRMNLLLGGDQVRRAEDEAVEFYNGKSRALDARLDDVASELSEVRASYDVVLDRALSDSGGAAGAKALSEAQPLRARISSLEAEQEDLLDRKDRLNGMVATVEQRDRERRRLADQVEAASVRPEDFGMPMTSIGLAPPPLASETAAPLEDDALMRDLLERDPAAARRLLFQSDPKGYFTRFPLRPPSAALSKAMTLPLPDPPGQR
ncbi:MAG: hypothetical protein AAGA20_17790 [Planctomycetota bacterium]